MRDGSEFRQDPHWATRYSQEQLRPLSAAEREMEDLKSSALVIREAISHLRTQLHSWEMMLTKTQNKMFELQQQIRPKLEAEYAARK